MKTILVPTDFSTTSQHAFFYAQSLAQRLNASIKVVHFYNGLLQIEQPVVLKAGMTRHETLEYHLKNFIKAPEGTTDEMVQTKLNIQLEVASAVSVQKGIVELTKDPEHLLTVMGTTGSHDAIGRLLGSVSTAVAQQATGPVILVPAEAPLDQFQNILFASNYESVDEVIIDDLMYLAEIFQSRVHFVHVSNQVDQYEQGARQRLFEQLFSEKAPNFAFEMATIEHDSVEKGLNEYAEQHNVDLIVLVNRDRGFFDNIRQRSMTQRMGLFTKVPIMVFHLGV